MGKIAVVCVLERHDYGSFGSVLPSPSIFHWWPIFFPIDRWKGFQAPPKRRIRPILAHEPGVFGAGTAHVVENHHVTVMQNG